MIEELQTKFGDMKRALKPHTVAVNAHELILLQTELTQVKKDVQRQN